MVSLIPCLAPMLLLAMADHGSLLLVACTLSDQEPFYNLIPLVLSTTQRVKGELHNATICE